MSISIIIPSLNEVAAIDRAVRCATALNPLETIVVDGGSTDGTRERLDSLPCRAVESPPGRALQMNRGAALATGQWLLFLHADTWLEPTAKSQIAACCRDAAIGAAVFRQQIEQPGWRYRCLEWGNAQRVRWTGLGYGDQGLLIRRPWFQQLGGFPDVPLMEDLILMRRLRRQYDKPQLLPGPLHLDARHWQPLGVVRQTLHNWSLTIRYFAGASPDKLARRNPTRRSRP